PTGGYRWFASRIRAIYDADGTPRRLTGTMRDITEEREAAAAVERARAAMDLERRRLQAVLEALPVGAIIADERGRMIQITETMRRIWGGQHESQTVDEYARWRGWWADSGRPLAAGDWALARALHGETVVGDVVDIERFDGTRGTIHNNAAPIRDAEGRVTGAVVIAVDLTERRHLEAQLRQAQKMEAVGLLAGGVAHDFNNLLTAILGHVDLIRGDVPPQSRLAADLDIIERAAVRGADLTRQLLAFSRKQVLQPVVLDLNAIIAESEPLLRRVVGDTVAMELDLGAGVQPVRADRGQLEQVVMNLALNARDAMPHGGTLTIRTERALVSAADAASRGLATEGEYVRLTIADTGTGMSDAVRIRVFEPFFTTKDVGKGTGLGLATVYGIVQQSGGAISVESSVGMGAVFTVLLPRAKGPVSGAVYRPRGARGAGETILVVEDESAVRLTLRRTFERANYQVLEARHGGDALLIWRAHRDAIALVVTDVRMPELDGFALAEILRREKPGIRVVFLSGYSSDAVKLHPGDAFLSKPFDVGELLATVRTALEQHAS
ncbi:MAG TPA: ATP-binding protein, partial [Gemmatimonadaceae bacterium]|nr:ATP-binding protein [Gemmatimonadaceae bacterium]